MNNGKLKDISLFEALLLFENLQEVKDFFSDLCTPSEIRSLNERWKVACYLAKNELSYRAIHQITGASLTTIGRVARSLREEPHQGYKKILNKIKK